MTKETLDRKIKIFRMGMIVILLFHLDGKAQSVFPLIARHINDNIIIVQKENGSDNQLAINSAKGIVVFGTHWGPDIEREYRAVVAGEFKNDNFRFVVNPAARIIGCGGNVLYGDAIILAQQEVYDDMVKNKANLKAEIQREIAVFTRKANDSRNILKQTGLSKEERFSHTDWMNYCQRIADDLAAGYKLVMPSFIFKKKIIMDLGNMVVHLEDFAGSGLIVWIPEEKFLMFSGMFDPQHIIITPRGEELEIDQWLAILEEYLVKCRDVSQVVLGYKGIWPLKKIADRKDFIAHLWTEVKRLTNDGLDFEQAKEKLSIDNEFSYIKTWDLYKKSGDAWVKDDFNKVLTAFWIQLHPLIGAYIETFIDRNGPEKGMAEFQNILKNRRKEFYVSEAVINSLGYRLLGKGMKKTAIAIFESNAELYPQSANAYDSLAEAYMKNGQKELAVKNYEKSLALNPGNANARDNLEKLKSME